jgi:hypothetical protein
MEPSGPEFIGGEYVVRYGLRRFRGALIGLLVWTGFVFLVAAYASSPSIPSAVGLALGELGLLAGCGYEIARAARREVLFAVYADGVYFGSGVLKEDVPWELICAVEIFTEQSRIRGLPSSRSCVGVRVVADSSRRLDPASQATFHAGRRSAYRRMSGWSVDLARLADAVHAYAPGLPVIEGGRRLENGQLPQKLPELHDSITQKC